jgi:hypothetical protein
MAIVAPHRGKTSRPTNISSGRAALPRRPNIKTFLFANVATKKSP